MSFDVITGTNSKIVKLLPNHVKRDELISTMLQDRNTLRIISAPHGFGKTELAREYAARLFSEDAVMWIDGLSPSFLLSLDTGNKEVFQCHSSVKLIVLDNLPWLHEVRAEALSKIIDAALYDGIEVILTVTPSCDCLSSFHPDRLIITAHDLLVSETECLPRQFDEQDGDSKVLAKKRWREAGIILFGHTPHHLWSAASNAQQDCMCGLFSEKLPQNILCAMFCMLLFKAGNIKDLESIDVILHSEEIGLLCRDYPVFGIDVVSGTFNIGEFDINDLKQAILINKLEQSMLDGSNSLSERVLGALFRRGDLRRGSEIIEVFCDDEVCAGWLEECGWDFLDAGELSLVSTLFDRCPEYLYVQSLSIQAMHAWLAGLSGDTREACHIARRILSSGTLNADCKIANIAARLALAQFNEDALTESNFPALSSQEAFEDSLDFLAAVLDDCSHVEITRAFSFDAADMDAKYEKVRRSAGKIRARRLASMFTEYADRFSESRAYRVAMHILAYVDSVELRHLVQELGCDEILRMRRCGVSTFSEAIFVCDMWQTGYFGLVGPVMDRRDSKVLDGAAHMIERLARCCDYQNLHIPWEAQGLLHTSTTQKPRINVVNPKVEDMYVRMFGGFEVTVGDRYLSEGKWRKKARALFGLLVLNNGRDVPRDDLFAQLWPGISHANALDNFYNVWGNCTSIIGESPYIERNGEYCRVDPRFVRSDVAEFEQLTRHLLVAEQDSNYLLDTYAKIEVLYRGCLMPSEKNVRVINAQRDRYRAMYTDAMTAATEFALNINDSRIALWFARKAMEEDQTREDVYRTLMKAQIAAGQRCSAIKTYHVCREFLQNTLGLDPSLETRELYSSLITNDPELLQLEAAFNAKPNLPSLKVVQR